MFSISRFNTISDDKYYYVFRSLEAGDLKDINAGISDEMRTDRERYEGPAKYRLDSTISLEEMFDHIKIHYRHDTNCISFTTNAGVAILYGRDNDAFNHDEFNDQYIILRIPKNELGTKSFFAPEYFIDEIRKIISNYYEQASDLEKKIFDLIDNCITMEQLKRVHSFDDESVNELFQGGIEFKTVSSLDYSSLNSEQNLEKNKILAKMKLLPFNIVPNVDNSILARTIGSAFASTEITHYGNIKSNELIKCPDGFIDIFAILQQSSHPKVKEVENILIKKLQNNELGNLEKYGYSDYNLTQEDLSIDRLYNATEGKVDFRIMRELYMKTIYLAKSKLRTYHSIKMLESILGDEYQDLLTDLRNTYGIESKVINKLSIEKIKLSDSIGLDFSSETEMRMLGIVLSEYSSETNLRSILNNKELCFQILMEDLFEKSKPIDRNTYFANAIIDSFDWSKYNIKSIDPAQRQQLFNKLIENDCYQLYYKLKEKGISESDISSVLLTTIIRGKSIDTENIDVYDIFDLEELEYFIGYYKLKEADIKLASYQATAINNIEESFRTRNYSAAILPIGEDKLVVAIAELLNMTQNKDAKILYLVPNDTMIYQIENYIFNYVIGTANTFGKSFKERKTIIKERFPNLVIAKYSSLVGLEKENYLTEKYDYVIMDELHKTGADNVLRSLKTLFENQTGNVKVLGLATTSLRDSDGVDMTDYWASHFGYSDEETSTHKHLALNLNTYEAISLGYVVNPRKVVCEYELLRDNGDFDNISERIALIEDEQARNAALEEYERCRKEASFADGIKEILNSNLQKGKRYIVYCPIANNKGEHVDENDENSRITGDDIIQEYTELLKQYLGEDNIECFNMQGSSSVAIANLARFENSSNGKTSFMLVIDKLNETVNVQNDGIIWFRSIDKNSSILCTKQLENALYPLYPGQEVVDDERPIVIDLTNNLYRVKKNGEVNKKDYVGALNAIISWMNHTGETIIPDINSSISIESGYAKTLRRVQKKYLYYVENPGTIEKLSSLDRHKVEEIIKLGNSIELWNIVFPEETKRTSDKKTKSQSDDLLAVTGVLSDFDRLSTSVDEAFKNNWISLDFDGKIDKIFNAIIEKNGDFIDKENYMYKWLVSAKNKETLINKAQFGDIKCIYIGLRMGRKSSPWVSHEMARKFYSNDKTIGGIKLFPFDSTDISYRFTKQKKMDERIDLVFECLINGIENSDISNWLKNGQIVTRVKKEALNGNPKAMYICLKKEFIKIWQAMQIEQYKDPNMEVEGVRLYPEDSMYIKPFEKNIENIFNILKENKTIQYPSEQYIWLKQKETEIIEAAKNGNAKAMYICLKEEFISIQEAIKMEEYKDPNMEVEGLRLYPEDSMYIKPFEKNIENIFVHLKRYNNIWGAPEKFAWLSQNETAIIEAAKNGNAKAMYICLKVKLISIQEAIKMEEYKDLNMRVEGVRLYPEEAMEKILLFQEYIEGWFNRGKIYKYTPDGKNIYMYKHEIIEAAKNGNAKAMYICLKEKYISIQEALEMEPYKDPNMKVEGVRLYPKDSPYINTFEKNIENIFVHLKRYNNIWGASEKSAWLSQNKTAIIESAKNGNAKAMYICLKVKLISIQEAIKMEEYKDPNMEVGGVRLYPEDSMYIKSFEQNLENSFNILKENKTLRYHEKEYQWVWSSEAEMIEAAKNGNAKAMYICLKIGFISLEEAIKMEEYKDPNMEVEGVRLYPEDSMYIKPFEKNIENIFNILKENKTIQYPSEQYIWLKQKETEIIEAAKNGNAKAMYICLKEKYISIQEAIKMEEYKNPNMEVGGVRLYPEDSPYINTFEKNIENIFNNLKENKTIQYPSEQYIWLKQNETEIIEAAKNGNAKAMYISLKEKFISIQEALKMEQYKDLNMEVGGVRLFPSNETNIYTFEQNIEIIFGLLKRYNFISSYPKKVSWMQLNKERMIEAAKNGNAKAMCLCLRRQYISVEEALEIDQYKDPNMEVDGVRLYPKGYGFNEIKISEETLKELFSKITYHDTLLICGSDVMGTINMYKNGIIKAAKTGSAEAMYICLRKHDENGKQWIAPEEALKMDYYKDKNMLVGSYKLYPKTENDKFLDFVNNVFDKIKNSGRKFSDDGRVSAPLLSLAKTGNMKAIYICLRITDKEGNSLINEIDIINSYPIDTTIEGAYLYPSIELENLNSTSERKSSYSAT